MSDSVYYNPNVKIIFPLFFFSFLETIGHGQMVMVFFILVPLLLTVMSFLLLILKNFIPWFSILYNLFVSC